MYLARKHIDDRTHYVIRHSYLSSGHYKYRDLFDIGPDPTRFIIYPGGNSYYYDPCIEEAIIEKGVQIDPDELDDIFFEFLNADIQRVITGFDRTYKNGPKPNRCSNRDDMTPAHIFDKRRFHFLRFGFSYQQYIYKVPEKIFRPLKKKSRDELEYYFTSEERKLKYNQLGPYLSIIFELHKFIPVSESKLSLPAQLDEYFMNNFCRLNKDSIFLSGEPEPKGLFDHLIRYAITYFDETSFSYKPARQYVRDFINRHRTYRPPAKVRIKIKEAEQLFGHRWKELKQMSKDTLTRIFRKAALKHHPDKGGDAETFRRLVQYYKTLLNR